jgi:hypothetical protein
MSTLIALLILGSVATSASAAAVDEVLSPLSHQQQSSQAIRQTVGRHNAVAHAVGYFGRGAAGFSHWSGTENG